jgi:hypothetical protein
VGCEPSWGVVAPGLIHSNTAQVLGRIAAVVNKKFIEIVGG